jgi:hypothetical protein
LSAAELAQLGLASNPLTLAFSATVQEHPRMLKLNPGERTMTRATTLIGISLVAVACSGSAMKSPAEPAPSEIAIPVEPEAPPEPPEEVIPPTPLATLAGDDKIAEPWRTRFRTWLTEQAANPFTEVIKSEEITNSVSLVLRRRIESNGECREGPSRLTLVYESPEVDLQHFGQDCCPGTACTRDPQSWNLRYLNALVAKDWSTLALLVPAKGKLMSNTTTVGTHVSAGPKSSRKFTRKDVAAGKFDDGPGCDLVYTAPSCGPLNAQGTEFTCACDGGGYHVDYTWKKEGAGFVLSRIDEQSH